VIFSLDLWHKHWGFGFTVTIWENFDETGENDHDFFVRFDLEWQIKAFGRSWGTGDLEAI